MSRPSAAAAASSSSSPASVTTRSRTLLFFSFRDSSARPRRTRARAPIPYGPREDVLDEERQGLLPPSPPRATFPHQPPSLPPKWVELSAEVESVIAAVHAKTQALDKLHAKHVLPGFTDRSAEEREIQSVTVDITRDFRHCHKLIQQMVPDEEAASPAHVFPPGAARTMPSRHAVLAAQNVQRALAAKVQDLSGTFRRKQRVYMEKLQGHAVKNQDLLTGSQRGQEGLSALEEDVKASQQIPLDMASQSTATLVAHQDVELQGRTTELSEIARSIAALAELFRDLNMLVIDQGTILDSVEYNVEMAAVSVGEAVMELGEATRYQKNTSRRQCIFLLVLIILGLVLVLIFKPRRHAAAESGSDGGAPSTGMSMTVPGFGGGVRAAGA